MRVAIARLVVVFALPLHFHGRLGILRSMFIPGALHGIEASFLAESSVRKLRSAFCKVAWSRRQPIAHVGAVLSLLDGPVGCDPAFCVVWFRFRLMRRYLAFRPEEIPRVYRLLHFAAEGSSGHGPAHLLLESAAEIGFSWCSRNLGWDRLVYLYLVWLMVQFSIFGLQFLMPGGIRYPWICVLGKVFGVAHFLIFLAPCSSLTLTMFGREIRHCFEVCLLGVYGMIFCWERLGILMFLVGFVVGMIMMGIYFGNALFHLWLRYVKILNFTTSWRWISPFGLVACFGMGGCLCFLVPIWVLLGLGIFLTVLVIYWSVLWVPTPLLFCLIGSYLLVLMLRLLPSRLLGNLMFGLMGVGLRIGFLLFLPLVLGFLLVILVVFGLGVLGGKLIMMIACCRGYCSVPGPLQSVQRAELWGVVLALQASRGVHLGVDNLNVVRHVGRLLDGNIGALPFQVVPDGDLLCLINHMLLLRDLDTVKITKVKGHASEDMVVGGRVRDLDRLGNIAADEAADFGRRRVPVRVIDARRNLVGVCSRWYPVVSHLHRFFVAIARAVVNHDDGGGTAPNPLVWSAGSLPKRRRIVDAVRNFAFLPGLVGIWSGDWASSAASCITVEDVRVWPYSVSLLVKNVCFPEHFTLAGW